MVIFYTGDGKGKTTAALGLAVRALGQNMRVCIIQFIKGRWPTGEKRFFSDCNDLVEFHVAGSGFTWQAVSPEEPLEAARDGWRLAKKKIASDSFDLVILDELTYPLQFGYLDEDEVLDVLRHRPARLHLVITGRYAEGKLFDIADLVTEMREVKHPFHDGQVALPGIEY